MTGSRLGSISISTRQRSPQQHQEYLSSEPQKLVSPTARSQFSKNPRGYVIRGKFPSKSCCASIPKHPTFPNANFFYPRRSLRIKSPSYGQRGVREKHKPPNTHTAYVHTRGRSRSPACAAPVTFPPSNNNRAHRLNA